MFGDFTLFNLTCLKSLGRDCKVVTVNQSVGLRCRQSASSSSVLLCIVSNPLRSKVTLVVSSCLMLLCCGQSGSLSSLLYSGSTTVTLNSTMYSSFFSFVVSSVICQVEGNVFLRMLSLQHVGQSLESYSSRVGHELCYHPVAWKRADFSSSLPGS